MAYERQLQTAMNRLDESLARLRNIIKRGQVQEAIQFMEEGELKDRYEELQNIINISQTGNIGARGTSQTGTF
jgi:DNA replicative helicase MCM subunit Mcm2 (Cdc46/Mcm family)